MTMESSERTRLRRLVEVELRISGALSAREIAHQVAFAHPGVDRSSINGLLYSSPSMFECDDGLPPLWRLVNSEMEVAQADQEVTGDGACNGINREVPAPTAFDGVNASRQEMAVEEAALSSQVWQEGGVAEGVLIGSTLLDMRLTDTLGSLVPSVPRHLHVAQLGLPTRAQNGLQRGGVERVGDLDGIYVRDLRDFRGVGRGTSLSILDALLEADALYSSAPVNEELEPSAAVGMTAEGLPPRQPDPGSDLVDDLRLVADWFMTIGKPDQPLLDSDKDALPAPVANSLAAIMRTTAKDLSDPTRPSAASLVNQSLLSLGERDLGVVRKRLFSSPTMTLDAIGLDIGLTRERVRQIVNSSRDSLVASWDEDPMMAGLANAIRERVGFLLPLKDLLEALPALSEDVPAVAAPLWHVIDQVDDEYEIVDGWCVSGTMEEATQSTIQTLLAVADENGVVSVSEAVAELGLVDEGSSGGWGIRRWLADCGLPSYRDAILTRSENLPDRAAAVLSIFGRPTTAEHLLAEMESDRTVGSLKNAMGSDPRFSRVGRGLWGLSAWGMEEYTGIRDLIRDALDRAGGEVGVEDLAADLSARFGVAANSVRTYAASVPFELKGGVVRFAPVVRSAPVGHTRPVRRLFRGDGSWKWRLTITTEHLRGSGFFVPAGLASRVGLRPGDTLQLESRLGSQAMRWNAPQPSLGTIRRFLLDLGVEAGQEVFLVVGSSGFDVEVFPSDRQDPLRRALVLTGSPPDSADPIPALCRAIEIPEDSSVLVLIDALVSRGDADVADLLTPWAHEPGNGRTTQGADVDSLMELLR